MVTLSELVDEILAKTALDSIYGAMQDGDERLNNIYSFNQLVAGFESSRQSDLERFLEHLDNLEAGKGYSISDDSFSEAVRIMSIHKSKGLEFPVVFVCGLSKGFNDEDLYAPVICDRELGLGLYTADMELRVKYPNVARKAIANKMKASAISEEMRILYVALTRAKDRLIMTYSRQGVEKRIHELSMRMQLMPKELMALDVSSAGDWVLMTAMHRSESAKLFENTAFPDEVAEHADKWIVDLVTDVQQEFSVSLQQPHERTRVSDEAIEKIGKFRYLSYSHQAATQYPSKQTATQLKGRYKDHEASEGTSVKRSSYFRKPSFMGATTDGRAYGTAMHRVMQYVNYRSCGSMEDVSSELLRLVKEGYISEEQKNMIDAQAVCSFFQSDLGTKLMDADHILREFKFSILDNAERYEQDLQGESVLLQGVVDCALIENDGITIIDFKTDRVTEETLPAVTEMYKQQIGLYAHAMSRIYQLPVKKTALYYFRLKQFVYV